MFSSSTTWDRSTMHPNFDPKGVRIHDLQIMTVHSISLRRPRGESKLQHNVNPIY